jgi:aspartate-semialdehyde dehydrogenase
MSSNLKVALVGATGAVGQELLRLLAQRSFPLSQLRLFASPKSKGKKISFKDSKIEVETPATGAFDGIDYAFFSAGASRSKEFAPLALKAGATVIDNSSAFRMDPEVPLIIPEVNPYHLHASHKLIAVPNCSAIILLTAIAPLQKLGRFARVQVSTYQSASGGGAAMMQDLLEQTRQFIEGQAVTPKVSYHPYAFNLFSHNTPINEHGYNEEEWKVIQESRKILGLPELRLNVTCVRVPVLRAHSESITIEFEDCVPDPCEVRAILAQSPGVRVVDDPSRNHFPMPSEASGQGDVLVGRIRRDLSHPKSLNLFISGDQLLKGAALNAIQIAELLELLKKNAGSMTFA